MSHDEFLEVAGRIGGRLARQAIWDSSICTWEIRTSDRSGPGRSTQQRADGPIYQGTSGIAWFLAELSRATADAELARVAEGGLRHALQAGAEMAPAAFGFHSGRVGVAWAAARVARLLEKPEYLEDAWNLLQPLQGNEAHDMGLDVIAGAAGAIPALLELGSTLEREEPLAIARRLGEHLIRRAHREPDGWSWPMMSNTVARHLNGLAHGAAGAGLAFLELARATGEARFRFAAEMAFLYERHFYNPETSNWPDLRNQELGNFTFYEGRQDELLQQVRQGALPRYELQYMTAWCHGSPGIGLSRLRAFELTGQELYRREAEAAVRSTLESVEDPRLGAGNYSLCHGHAGNCELLLFAAAQLGEPAWRERAAEVARYGWETYEKAGQPWPCGTVNSVSDPSLLLGEAGIGLFYLRLAEPDVPSPLLLRPEHGEPVPQPHASAEDFSALARESADEFFAISRRAVERLTGSTSWTPPPGNGQPLAETPAEALHAALCRQIETTDGELRELLADAFRLDRERWEATRALVDFSAEFVHGLTHQPWDDLDPRQAHFRRAPDSRLLTLQRDWAPWAAKEPGGGLPPEEEVDILLFRRGNRIHAQRVGILAALLLSTLEDALAFDALVERAAESFDGSIDRPTLAAKLLPQLEQLYRAGFVVSIHSPSEEDTRHEETEAESR